MRTISTVTEKLKPLCSLFVLIKITKHNNTNKTAKLYINRTEQGSLFLQQNYST